MSDAETIADLRLPKQLRRLNIEKECEKKQVREGCEHYANFYIDLFCQDWCVEMQMNIRKKILDMELHRSKSILKLLDDVYNMKIALITEADRQFYQHGE